MALVDSAVDAGLIVSPITGKGSEGARDLVEQRIDLRAIVDIVGRQL
jgi:hypothetical protein